MHLPTEEIATLHDFIIFLLVQGQWITWTVINLLRPVDIPQSRCTVDVQLLLMPMQQGGEYQFITATGMMETLEELRVLPFRPNHIFRYTAMPREPLPSSPKIRDRLTPVDTLADEIEAPDAEVDNLVLTVREITHIPRHHPRWIFLYHALFSEIHGVYPHIASAPILLEEVIKHLVGMTWIVLTRDEMEIVATIVVCLMQQAERTRHLRISTMRHLHPFLSLKEEDMRIFLLTVLYELPPP